MATLDSTLSTVTQRTGSLLSLETAPDRGRFLSQVSTDIAAIMRQLNSVYFPLTNALSKETGIDALDYGIAGNVIFTHVKATAADALAFYDSNLNRARTIKETVDVLLSEISRLENAIQVNVDLPAYDDTVVRGLIGNNQLNLRQLKLDTMGSNYSFDNDGNADLTYPLSQAVDALGSFFSGFPGTGNTYSATYPALALNVLLSSITLDTTLAQSIVTDLVDNLADIRTFVGMDTANDSTPDYSAHGALSNISDGDSLELAIQKLDAAVNGSSPFSVTSNVISNTPSDVTLDDFVFGSTSLDDTGDAAHDARIIFDKSRLYFAAGGATGTQWDSINRPSSGGGINLGLDNRVGGIGATAIGTLCTASGTYSRAVGYYAHATSTSYGGLAHASGRFATGGDAQYERCILRGQTTDATPTLLTLDGLSSHITLPSNTAYAFIIRLIARRTNLTGYHAHYTFEGTIHRDVAAATTVLDQVTKAVVHEDSAAWDASVAAETTLGALQLTVTGEAGFDINWVATAEITRVTG